MDRKKVNNRLFFWYLLLWLFLFISLFVAYCFYFAKTATTLPKWVGLCAGAMALLLAASKNLEILFHDGNNSFLKKIITYFYNGAMIFFKKTNIVIAILALIISIPLYNFLGKEFVFKD